MIVGIRQAALIGSSYGGRVALEVAARWSEKVSALALLCSGSPEHVPSDALRCFAEREDALIAAGDVDGAVDLNVETFLGPEAVLEKFGVRPDQIPENWWTSYQAALRVGLATEVVLPDGPGGPPGPRQSPGGPPRSGGGPP